MSELVFNVHLDEDGGYYTRAETEAIHTQGDTWEQLRSNIAEAVEAYYSVVSKPKPNRIRIHLVHDEELLVA